MREYRSLGMALTPLCRIIREEEPKKPSTKPSTMDGLPANRRTEPAKLTMLVRGELDWIVMKALEKDRNRRYATVSAPAADLERHLADEPMQACPPSALDSFRKFARRNRMAMVTAAAVVLAVGSRCRVPRGSGRLRSPSCSSDLLRYVVTDCWEISYELSRPHSFR